MSYPVWRMVVVFSDIEGRKYTRLFWACGLDGGDAMQTLFASAETNGLSESEMKYGSVTAITIIGSPDIEAQR